MEGNCCGNWDENGVCNCKDYKSKINLINKAKVNAAKMIMKKTDNKNRSSD